jgi:hypothetical protein
MMCSLKSSRRSLAPPLSFNELHSDLLLATDELLQRAEALAPVVRVTRCTALREHAELCEERVLIARGLVQAERHASRRRWGVRVGGGGVE